MDDFVTRLLTEGNQVRSMQERAMANQNWQDCADYLAPELATFTVKVTPGQRQGDKIINSKGVLSADRAATLVSGFLMGEGTTWLDLRIGNGDPELPVRRWLDQCVQILMSLFSAPESGFYTCAEQTHLQLQVLGTGPFYVGQKADGMPYYRAEFLGNCALMWDTYGALVGCYRYYTSPAWQLEKEFGRDNLPDVVKRSLEKDRLKEFQCLHVVRQRQSDDPYQFANFPFLEAYLCIEAKAMLAPLSGYYEMPWIAPRWKVAPNEQYGRSPGMRALADVKMLQNVDKDTAKGIHKLVDPMMLYEDDGTIAPNIDQRPGSRIAARKDNTGRWNIEALNINARPDVAFEYISMKEALVEKHFHLDAFQLFDKVTPKGSVAHASAFEVGQRAAEQMRVAGPALSRLRAEYLYPVVRSTLRMLARSGRLPPPPPQLRDRTGRMKPIYAEYVSPLAVAQRGGSVSSMLQYIGNLIPLRQADPRALDGLNFERYAKELAIEMHVPAVILNTDAEVAALNQARDAAMQQQLSAQNNLANAQAANQTAQAVTTLQGG